MTSGKDMWRHAAMRAAVSFMPAVDSSVSTSSLSAGIDAAASVLKWLPSERRMPLSASLLCHSGVAAESVPHPWHRRAAFLFDGEDYVEGLDHMQYQWFAQRFRQGDVAAENVGLRVDAGSAQTVYARLAYGCDRRMCCGALKQARNQVSRQSPTDVCPRNNACLLLDGRGQDSR